MLHKSFNYFSIQTFFLKSLFYINNLNAKSMISDKRGLGGWQISDFFSDRGRGVGVRPIYDFGLTRGGGSGPPIFG